MGLLGRQELYDKYRGTGLQGHPRLGGLADQYICHQEYAFWRPGTWNLDAWRPDVSYGQTAAAACNPQ